MSTEKEVLQAVAKTGHVEGSMEELSHMVKAKMPLIQVVTYDEEFFLKELFSKICMAKGEQKYELFFWSAWQGVVEYTGENSLMNVKRAEGEWDQSWNPQKALELILKHQLPKNKEKKLTHSIFVMRDMTTVLAQPIPRQMRDMYGHLEQNYKTLMVLGGTLCHGAGGTKGGIEPTLEKQMVVFRWKLPERKEIEELLRERLSGAINVKRQIKMVYTEEEYYEFSRALQGLTYNEIVNTQAICVTELNCMDTKRLLEEKKQIVMRSDILEYISSDDTMEELGGLDNLKQYIKDHTNSHSEEAEAFGVDPVKGILLTGVPGTGKSASAKAIGNYWKVPTLRLDIGKVMTGLVGGSEEKMRSVINMATSIAPCVTGDTLITLANGSEVRADKLYEVVSSGEKINLLGHDPVTNEKITIRMHSMIRRDATQKQLLQITTENGKMIKVTENHKFLTQRGWVEAKDLTLEDDIKE